MQTVHLGDSRPSPASSAGWQAAQALAGLIGSAGEAGFEQTAIACLNTALPLCWWSVYSLHPAQAPTLHLGGSYHAPDRTQQAFRFYADGPWRHDPTFDAARERLAQGGLALTHWHASEIPQRHRSGIYTRHALRERVSPWIRQLDAPDGAVIGVPGKARRRRKRLCARRSNAAWRAERGADGRIAQSPRR